MIPWRCHHRQDRRWVPQVESRVARGHDAAPRVIVPDLFLPTTLGAAPPCRRRAVDPHPRAEPWGSTEASAGGSPPADARPEAPGLVLRPGWVWAGCHPADVGLAAFSFALMGRWRVRRAADDPKIPTPRKPRRAVPGVERSKWDSRLLGSRFLHQKKVNASTPQWVTGCP